MICRYQLEYWRCPSGGIVSESRAYARQGNMAGRMFVVFAASHHSGVQVHLHFLPAQGGSLTKVRCRVDLPSQQSGSATSGQQGRSMPRA